jgi:diadenosine tetraphosphate (Ap4A) HIT family hydrolase
MTEPFAIDPRIVADSFAVTALRLADLRLMNDARFPWLVLVPRKPGLVEIIDLDAAEQVLLMTEIGAVSTVLKTLTGCDKLNVAALGNAVRQLHVHIIARTTTDTAWPAPVWGKGAAVAYQPGTRDRLIFELRAALPS